MKKKGFTLIELLAVIVILAIIALIATPIVMNVIENSRKGAAERSAENYLKAVETVIGTERIDGNIMSGEYTILSGGDLCPDGIDCEAEPEKTIKIEMSGNKPSSGTIFIENGKVVEKLTEGTEKTSLAFPDYTVNYNGDGKLTATKNGEKEEEGGDQDPSQGENSDQKVVYRWSTENLFINDEIRGDYVTNPSELQNNHYLKHVLNEDNTIKESYGCVIFGDEEVCLPGGVSEDYFTDNTAILQELANKGFSCSFFPANSNCSTGTPEDGPFIRFYAFLNGGITIEKFNENNSLLSRCSVGGLDNSSICTFEG